jgi:hypothetical protein
MTMAYQMRCPCGTTITAPDDTFVTTVQAHLASEHPGREYNADQIMAFALPLPDRPATSSD